MTRAIRGQDTPQEELSPTRTVLPRFLRRPATRIALALGVLSTIYSPGISIADSSVSPTPGRLSSESIDPGKRMAAEATPHPKDSPTEKNKPFKIESGFSSRSINHFTPSPAETNLTDPDRIYEYHLEAIKLPNDITAPEITIAVVDSGMTISVNADLGTKSARTKVIENVDFSNSENTQDGINHGTSMGAILAGWGNNGYGGIGVASEASVKNLKVLNQNQGDWNNIISAVNHAAGTNIIVMSLNEDPGSTSPSACLPELKTAIENAISLGSLVVTSSGNAGGGLQSPANCSDKIINVGSANRQGQRSLFSAYDPATTVLAPGEGIPARDKDGLLVFESGTSPAAQIVAGAMADIMSATGLRGEAAKRQLLGNLGPNRFINVGDAIKNIIPVPSLTPTSIPTATVQPTALPSCDMPERVITQVKKVSDHLEIIIQDKIGNIQRLVINDGRPVNNASISGPTENINNPRTTLIINPYDRNQGVTVPIQVFDGCPQPWRTFGGIGRFGVQKIEDTVVSSLLNQFRYPDPLTNLYLNTDFSLPEDYKSKGAPVWAEGIVV